MPNNIAFVQSSVGTGSGVTMTSAPVQGHALIAIAYQQGMGSWSVGSGWTQIASATGVNTNSGPGGSAFYKIAGASESTSQRPTTTSASCVVIFEFSAASGFASNPVDVANFTATVALTPTSVACTSLTPASANEALLCAGYNNTTADSAPSSISGMTGLVTLSGGDTSGNGAAAYEIPGNAFSQAKTLTWGGSTQGKASGIQVFIKPAIYTGSESGSITGAGSLNKGTSTPVAGSMTGSGSFTRGIGSALTGSIAAAGTFSRNVLAQLAAALTPSGTFTRSITRAIAGSIIGAGSVTRSILQSLTASIAATSALSHISAFYYALSGSITASSTFTRNIARNLAAAITPTGTIRRFISRALNAVITAITFLGILPPRAPQTVYVTLPIVTGEMFNMPPISTLDAVTLDILTQAQCEMVVLDGQVSIELPIVEAVTAT